MTEGLCHHCGGKLEFEEKVFRNDTCPACGSDVYCCLNCNDYDESYPNQCRETEAERVLLKDHRNFCEYFEIAKRGGSQLGKQKAELAKKKLEELFKKK